MVAEMLPAPADQIDMNAARSFLADIFSGQTVGHAIIAAQAGDSMKHRPLALQHPGWLNDATAWIERAAPNSNIYVASANYADAARGRKKENIGQVPFLFCERDGATLGPLLPPPTITVETSAGRFQDWWKLAEPVGVGDADRYDRRIAAHCGIGTEAVDAGRLLRVPGTINHKPGRGGRGGPCRGRNGRDLLSRGLCATSRPDCRALSADERRRRARDDRRGGQE